MPTVDSKQIDYLIVGQGLAGSCLALQLILRGKQICVFDTPCDNHATAIAAGLFNPITGRVMTKTWLADSLFPYLGAFYSAAEEFLKQKFFFPKPLYRPFGSVQEQNDWMAKSASGGFANYLEHIFLEPADASVWDPFGGLLLKQSGYLDVNRFVDAIRAHLQKSAAYREEKLDETRLDIRDSEIRYAELRASKIIFCNGIECTQSQYFSWLPVNPLKGETLQIRMPPVEYIYNRGVYVVPGRTEDEHTVGATYDFKSQSPEITPGGRAELETKLKELIRLPYTVINQKWGIRPTTYDQKLIVGPHPAHQNVIIFNGLGPKGVSLAPYFSGQLAGWLEGQEEIMPEVNISRFKALYSKFV